MRAGLLEALFETPEPADLGPRVRAGVKSLTDVASDVAELALPARSETCLRALAWLWHDHLDEAHGAVQDLPGADAAFVHGIMHRREPDASNSRYWFHRVGEHPAFETLADGAAPVLASHAALPHRLIRDGRWDPFAFIDAVSQASRHPEAQEAASLLRELQRLETLALAKYLAKGPS